MLNQKKKKQTNNIYILLFRIFAYRFYSGLKQAV